MDCRIIPVPNHIIINKFIIMNKSHMEHARSSIAVYPMQYDIYRKEFKFQWTTYLFTIQPLLPEFFCSSFFGTSPNIGSFRLPTYRVDVHRKLFRWSLFILKLKFGLFGYTWRIRHVRAWRVKMEAWNLFSNMFKLIIHHL